MSGAGPPYDYKYLAIYDIETDDLAHTLAAFGQRSGTSKMSMSDAMASRRSSVAFKPMGELQHAK
jgi:hypothetical protein